MDMQAASFYRNLLYHRTSMLEGVRLVAFRNVGHLRRTSRRLGVSDADDADAYRAVVDGMIADQGMESNDQTRWMLELTNRYVWETYLCLVHAEIEAYQDTSPEYPELKFAPLDSMLETGARSFQRVKQLRHSIVHPENRVHLNSRWEKIDDAVDSDFGGTHFEVTIATQNVLDEYLIWLRDEQRKLFVQEIGDLKGITRPPGPDEYQRLDKLRPARDVLSRPLPLSGGSAGSDEVQAPPSILAWKPLLDALSTPGANQTGYPEGLKRIRAHCLQMLLRAVVFLSEALSYLDIAKMLSYMRAGISKEEALAKPFDLLLASKTPTTVQDEENFASLLRVSAALVAMPLRLYREATLARQDLRHEGIEELIREGFDQSTLDSSRNAVFHVPVLTVDPHPIDSNQAKQMEAMPQLLGQLTEFYGAVGR